MTTAQNAKTVQPMYPLPKGRSSISWGLAALALLAAAAAIPFVGFVIYAAL